MTRTKNNNNNNQKQVPSRESCHAEIVRDIQSRCDDDVKGFIEREARYHLRPEERSEEDEEQERQDDDDSGVRVVPPFVISLLRGGHMISGASVLPTREYFPRTFVRHLTRAAVPSICHAVVRSGAGKKETFTGTDVSSAVSRFQGEFIEGFCFAHGYTRLYSSDYYCVDCEREFTVKSSSNS